MSTDSSEDFFPRRATEQYGGKETVGSVLWLEHVEGIRYTAEDGSEHLLHPQDLAEDEAHSHGSPSLQLRSAMKEDVSLVAREQWLRKFVLRMLPLKIVGDSNQAPIVFNSDFKVFTVPQELTRNPGVIAEESVLFDSERGKPRDLTKEQAISFALRLVPDQGYVSEFGYYPGGMHSDYGIGALEITQDLISMQLHHRIYLELYRSKPDRELAPLIAPHQF